MKSSDKQVDASRRSFLSLAGAGAVAGGAVIAGGGTPAEASEVPDSQGNKGYRESDHVRRVYDLSRF